ncbi:MAG: STAS domain-containing protein [Planctomycetota bacterium]|jgi:anti-sigma B factor antagonist
MKDDGSYSEDVIRGVRVSGQTIVLELGGEIDMTRSNEVRRKFKELFQKKPAVVVVDMRHVGFIDSSGLAILVSALKWCRLNGSELKLVGLVRNVRSIFEICRLDSIFQIYDTEAEALS